MWIGEVVASDLKGWSPLNWRQLFADAVERRPRGGLDVHQVVHSIAIVILSHSRTR